MTGAAVIGWWLLPQKEIARSKPITRSNNTTRPIMMIPKGGTDRDAFSDLLTFGIGNVGMVVARVGCFSSTDGSGV
jgi:hypothetical protein